MENTNRARIITIACFATAANIPPPFLRQKKKNTSPISFYNLPFKMNTNPKLISAAHIYTHILFRTKHAAFFGTAFFESFLLY